MNTKLLKSQLIFLARVPRKGTATNFVSNSVIHRSRPAGRLWDCHQRRLRPGVLGIAAAELPSQFWIHPLPEAVEIVGYLHRTVARSEDLDDDPHPAAGYSGGGRQAEEILDARRQGRRLVALVNQASDPA